MNNWGDFEFNEPYLGDEILKINSVVLQKQYVEFMEEHDGGEGDIGETWLILFPLEELQEINNDYCIEEFLPNHIIIGSNGGGELYGINDEGYYFNVPEMIEDNIITLFGNDLDSLPTKINMFWK